MEIFKGIDLEKKIILILYPLYYFSLLEREISYIKEEEGLRHEEGENLVVLILLGII